MTNTGSSPVLGLNKESGIHIQRATAMPTADQNRAASVEVFTRTADNSALYSALAEAVEISDIGEKAGFDSGPDYRLIRIDRRLDVTSDREFEIALIDDLELSVAYYAR